MVLRQFGKAKGPDKHLGGTVDLEEWLQSKGVVTTCDTVDDLCLSEEFRNCWYDEMEAVKLMDDSARIEELAEQLSIGGDSWSRSKMR